MVGNTMVAVVGGIVVVAVEVFMANAVPVVALVIKVAALVVLYIVFLAQKDNVVVVLDYRMILVITVLELCIFN